MTLDTIIFLIAAVIAVFGATMMIVQRNPIASVLYLIVSLVAQAVLYIQLGGLFMGAVLIIVYAGAILVLFLFVIMLLNLRSGVDLGEPLPPLSRLTKVGLPFLFFVEAIIVTKAGLSDSFIMSTESVGLMSTTPDGFGSVEDVGMVLFQRYLYPFELTSILLLAAVVGAVVIARKERNDDSPLSEVDSGASATKEGEQ